MKRGTFILSALALFPLSIFAKIKTNIFMRTEKAFKVKAGEARFGEHYKMKGVTLNNLDIKISGTDTENDLNNLSKIITATNLSKQQIRNTLMQHHLYEYMDFNTDTVSMDRINLVFKNDTLYEITNQW